MKTVNIHVAKTHFSGLVDEVAAGAEIIIAKAGKPVAKLVPLGAAKPRIALGMFDGQVKIPDDFDAPLPDDVLDAFES